MIATRALIVLLLGAFFMSTRPTITMKYLKECPEHVTTCAQWSFSTWGRHTPHRSLEDYIESRKRYLNDTTLPLTIVAFDEQTPIGMCSLTIHHDLPAESEPWLGTLYVEPEYRGIGIGTLLEKAICEKALQMGYTKIYTFTSDPTVVPWYKKLNWQQRSMAQVYDHEVTVLEKALD